MVNVQGRGTANFIIWTGNWNATSFRDSATIPFLPLVAPIVKSFVNLGLLSKLGGTGSRVTGVRVKLQEVLAGVHTE